MDKRHFLSYGGGVNSTALLLYILDEGLPLDEVVFVNHSGDYPETYEYVDLIDQKVHPITHLYPDVQGFSNLYDYCWHLKMIPVRSHRWCTSKFKIRPLEKYFGDQERIVYIGIDADESHRAKPSPYPHERKDYPLIEAEMGRQSCVNRIEAEGLPIPMKSGCYFCPFARIGQVRDLAKRSDDLFCRTQALEDRNVEDRIARGKGPIYLYKDSLRKIIDPGWSPNQETLWEVERPCECGL